MATRVWTEAEYVVATERAGDEASRGRYDEARATLQDALHRARAAGDEVFAILLEGNIAGLGGDYEGMLAAAQRANELRPDCALALRDVGVALGCLERDTEALEWYDKALAVRPDDPDCLRDRGVALANLGRWAQAIEWYDRALSIRPDDPASLRERGAALGSLRRCSEGIEAIDSALALRPDDYHAMRNRGVVLGYLGKHSEALEWCEKALGIRPDDPLNLLVRGITLANLGRAPEALQCLDKALAIRPNHYKALRGRSVVLGLMGDIPGALAGLRQCLSRDPADEEAMIWLVKFSPADDARASVEQFMLHLRRREQERMEAERASRERIVKLGAWRSLSARSAHRIGNQLFASRGALRALKKAQDPVMGEAASDLEGCLDRVTRIVQEFQTFSRNEQPRLQPTQVGPLVREVVRRYGNVMRGVEVSAEIAEALPTCLVDRAQMDQALGELLENATHHTPAGGRIRVAAELVPVHGGERVRITVEDTGPGVPDKDKESIFEAFVTTRPGGSGLGLAIVKQIVENHGGTIREKGKAGEGARFEIELPALRSEEASQ